MSLLKKVSNINNTNSLSSKMRKRRMNSLIRLIEGKDVKQILDIGGTYEFWINNVPEFKKFEITLLNLKHQKSDGNNFLSVVGDATDLSMFRDQSFDLVFSNSVIEHLFTFENQKSMADEVKRVGRLFFVQTPNKYFPIEPHFLFPFYQFLPFKLKLFLLKNFKLGHIGQIKLESNAKEQINEIRLLSEKELICLFGEETSIKYEKFGGLVKSFIAYNI